MRCAIWVSTEAQFDRLAAQELIELDRRVARYRPDHPLPVVRERDVVLVDDGIATGVTVQAAIAALRRLDAAQIVVATPVCAAATGERLRALADDLVCVQCPEQFGAVGSFYVDFAQTTDDEVVDLLARSRAIRDGP